MLLRRIARPLLAATFIGQGVDSLRNPGAAGDAARPTLDGIRRLANPVSANIPTDAEGFALINAAVQIAAGLLLASGKLPRFASATLACTVVPGRLGAHMFWNEDDPDRRAQLRADFLTDVSLLGGLVIASADTAGKPSLGWRGRRVARQLSEVVTAGPLGGGSGPHLGEKLSHGVHLGAERGRELAGAAAEKGAPLVDAARERGGELAEAAREWGGELAATARERGAGLVDPSRRLPWR